MKLQVTIEGRAYEVGVELMEDDEPLMEERPYLPPAPVAAEPPAGSADLNVCRSPVNGLAIKVNVEPGQAVAAGELMVVLEAMKMETNIAAPRAAIVKTVHVKPAAPVKINQVLVEFE